MPNVITNPNPIRKASQNLQTTVGPRGQWKRPSYDEQTREPRNENFFHTAYLAGEQGLADELPSLGRFAEYVDTYYMDYNLATGQNGSYWLTLDDPAVPIELGYGDKFLE